MEAEMNQQLKSQVGAGEKRDLFGQGVVRPEMSGPFEGSVQLHS